MITVCTGIFNSLHFGNLYVVPHTMHCNSTQYKYTVHHVHISVTRQSVAVQRNEASRWSKLPTKHSRNVFLRYFSS